MAYTGFYLVSVGKPFSEKPTSAVGYDCLRASTGFCVNSQRMSISEAPAETGGGGLLLIGRLLLLLPLKAYKIYKLVLIRRELYTILLYLTLIPRVDYG